MCFAGAPGRLMDRAPTCRLMPSGNLTRMLAEVGDGPAGLRSRSRMARVMSTCQVAGMQAQVGRAQQRSRTLQSRHRKVGAHGTAR